LCVAVLEFDRARQGGIDPGLPLLGTLTFYAGVLFFPISYIFGDILTEVMSLPRIAASSGRICRAGVASLMAAVRGPSATVRVGAGKSSRRRSHIRNTPANRCGLIIAFLCGTFVTATYWQRMKIWTSGRCYGRAWWVSTLCGELVDSALFYSTRLRGYRNLIW